MKNLLTLFLLMLSSYWAYAQVCGTPSAVNPKIYTSTPSARGASTAMCINVYFHIVRNSQGEDAFQHPYIEGVVLELNKAFSPHNIVINNAGVDYINNTDFVQIDNRAESMSLGQVNSQANAINYYIVERLWEEGDGELAGTSNSIPSNHLVIKWDQVERAISAHELAHCLNLLHTYETSRGTEAINGTNCQTAGDLVCDTPADPGTGFESNSFTCTYTGGGGYNPLPDNIMADVTENCRQSFTRGQGERMRRAIAEEPLLQPIVSNNCVSMSKLDHLECSPATVTLTNIGTATTRWTVSNNVQIVAQTNTSITVTNTSNTSGEGWLKATLNNGMELTEEFWVGKPDASHVLIRGGGTLNQHATYNLRVSGDRHADRIEWVVPFGWYITTYGSNHVANITPTTTGSHTIYVRFINDCGVQYRNVSVCVQGGGYSCGGPIDPCANNPTGLPCLPDNPPPFSIGPNPASSVLTIKQRNNQPLANQAGRIHRKPQATYQLLDTKLSVKSAGPVSTLTNIDVSCFPKGVYILKIYGKTVQTHRVLID